jgi:hypothetical protein
MIERSMIDRTPPRLASWLLKQWGSPYQLESLAGDLFEQYQQGGSRAWYWRQVAAAVLIARGRFLRTMPWGAACRLLSRLVAETAAVLAAVVLVDQTRRTRFFAETMNHTFIYTLVVLLAAASIGFLLSTRGARRRQAHGAINALMLAFGVIALGVGTLTWADTLRDGRPPTCIGPGQ